MGELHSLEHIIRQNELFVNIIFLYPLSGQALNELKEYEAEKKNKKDRN